MFSFFDYFYYRACKFYEEHRGTGPRFSGLFAIATMQMFNILSLIYLFCFIKKIRYVSYWPILLITLIVLLLDGFRYNKVNYDVLKAKWKNENQSKLKKLDIAVLLYFIFTLLILMTIVVFLSPHGLHTIA